MQKAPQSQAYGKLLSFSLRGYGSLCALIACRAGVTITKFWNEQFAIRNHRVLQFDEGIVSEAALRPVLRRPLRVKTRHRLFETLNAIGEYSFCHPYSLLVYDN